MRSHTILFTVLFCLLVLLTFGRAVQDAEQLFQSARYEEEVAGDIEKAIILYSRVVTEATDKGTAARAQLRIGICYEKLGQKNVDLAKDAFQKVIDNYPSQSNEVKVAREKLSAILKAISSPNEDSTQFRMRRLWKNLDVRINNLNKVSPNGRFITFTDRNGGDLSVLDLKTQLKSRHTNNAVKMADLAKMPPAKRLAFVKDMKFASGSIWSPGGEKMAYGWSSHGIPGGSGCEVCITKIKSQNPTVLVHNDEFQFVQPKVWTADGNRILAAFFKSDPPQGRYAWIDVADKSIKMLEHLRTYETLSEVLGTVLLTPDEKHIVYDFPQNNDPSSRDIYCYSLEEGNEIKLVDHPSDDYILDITPDGKSLLFASNRRGSLDFWIIEMSGEQLSKEPRLVYENAGEIKPLGFDGEGTFYFGKNNWTSDVFTAAYENSTAEIKSSPKKVTQIHEGSNYSPAWSPDGKSLAYVSSRFIGDGYDWYLCTMTEGSETHKEYKLDFEDVRALKWAPDGEAILIIGKNASGYGIFEIDYKTEVSKQIELLDSGKFFWASWTPDKKRFLYAIQRPDLPLEKFPYVIMIHDIDTGQKKEILSSCNNVALSPDGHWLAFTKLELESLSRSLNVISTSGGEHKRVFSLGKYEFFLSLAWTSDGKGFVFSKYKDNIRKSGLWLISLGDDQPKKVEFERERLNDLDVHPDGEKMAFCSSTLSIDIWALENFLSEEK